MPNGEGRLHELVALNGRLSPAYPVHAALGKAQTVLVNISKRWVGGRHPRTPRTVPRGPGRLHPYDLSPAEETDLHGHRRHHRAQRYVGPTPQVCNVDHGAATRLQDPVRLSEHSFDHAQVLLKGAVPVVLLAHVVRGRRDHERHGVVGELGHLFGRVLEHPVQHLRGDLVDVLVNRPLGLAEAPGVERGRVVALSLACAERGCSGAHLKHANGSV